MLGFESIKEKERKLAQIRKRAAASLIHWRREKESLNSMVVNNSEKCPVSRHLAVLDLELNYKRSLVELAPSEQKLLADIEADRKRQAEKLRKQEQVEKSERDKLEQEAAERKRIESERLEKEREHQEKLERDRIAKENERKVKSVWQAIGSISSDLDYSPGELIPPGTFSLEQLLEMESVGAIAELREPEPEPIEKVQPEPAIIEHKKRWKLLPRKSKRNL
jgi:flagellar biosynthesis GTPase FlhF